jgi:hypothetical protein
MKMRVAEIVMLCVGLCLVALVLGAVALLGSLGEGDEMVVAAVDEDRETEIPPIDVAAPKETATATFALG